MSAYADMWNVVDALAILTTLVGMFRFFGRVDARTSIGLAALFQYLRCLPFMQGFGRTGALIRMINEIIKGGFGFCTCVHGCTMWLSEF